MNIIARENNIRTIRQNDPKFMLIDGLVTCPRAGFEISNTCPGQYKLMIMEAVKNGWLQPVAHIYGKELTMDAMR
jgi:hypothetical protein